jgi:hypothetical protein
MPLPRLCIVAWGARGQKAAKDADGATWPAPCLPAGREILKLSDEEIAQLVIDEVLR